MGRRGRPKKTNDQKLRDALARSAPNDRIVMLRQTFSFVTPSKGPDGRVGEIDQDICDPIGQMHALGLFDGHGHDPQDMRDKGRFWGQHYVRVMKPVGVKMGAYERSDRSNSTGALTAADLMFDRMNDCLPSYERAVLFDLIIEPLIGHEETTPWAQSLIDEQLLAKGKCPRMMRFPDEHDRARLEAVIRGLCCLVDGSLSSMRRAA